MMDGKLSRVTRRPSSPTLYCLHIQFILKSYSPQFGRVDDFVTLARTNELAKRRKQLKKRTNQETKDVGKIGLHRVLLCIIMYL